MKKFKFNLESVLKFRRNTEDNEKTVLAGLQAELMRLIRELAALREEYAVKSREFEQVAGSGAMTVHEIRSNHAYLKNIDYGIELKLSEIEEQRKLVEQQTEVVISAMRETKTLDRLKEEKFKIYAKEERKAHEKFVEEFVVNARSAAAR